jgi:hypothetical protein
MVVVERDEVDHDEGDIHPKKQINMELQKLEM